VSEATRAAADAFGGQIGRRIRLLSLKRTKKRRRLLAGAFVSKV
jgi:hypothetical protein